MSPEDDTPTPGDTPAPSPAPPDAARRRLLRLAPLVPLGSLLWWAMARRPDPDAGGLRVTAIDVGQGDSTLIQTPAGRTILIDGGGTSDETHSRQSAVRC